jgi:hypothetical protein
MGILDLFRRKKDVVVMKNDTDDLNRQIAREIQNEKNAIERQRLRDSLEKSKIEAEMQRQRAVFELEKIKAEAELARIRVQNEVEDAREDRMIRRAERIKGLIPGDDDDEVDNTDNLLAKLLTPILQNLNVKTDQGKYPHTPTFNHPELSPPIVQNPIPQPTVTKISDAQIKQIWSEMSSFEKAAAKAMSDDEIRQEIIQEIPTADAESINRAIIHVRSS